MKQYCINIILLLLMVFWQKSNGDVQQLIPSNIDQILSGNELVFVNFYADWCRFSQMLKPVFEDAGKKVKEKFPDAGKVVFGKVDCDKESGVCQQYSVSKYPTLKVFRLGKVVKREYRGQRTVDALAQFVDDQLKENIQKVDDMEVYDNLDRKKRHIIGYFETDQGEDYQTYKKVAKMLQDDCKFYTSVGPVSQDERLGGNKIVYKPPGEHVSDMAYSGRMTDYNIMLQWTQDKCVPLVREITFENAEELTEEGLPFMILFHNPDDTETPERYRKQVAVELLADKSSINFLTADGLKFTHPLYHLGKTNKDLPIIAIDSFRHMYLWKNDVKSDIDKPGLLKEFIKDLHSGKLHRDFHNPPPADQTPDGGNGDVIQMGGHIGGHGGDGGDGNGDQAFHLDIQQQVITNRDGFKIQVLKILQHEGAVHVDEIKDKLEKIEENTEKEHAAEKAKSAEDGAKLQDGDSTDPPKFNLSMKDFKDGNVIPQMKPGEENKGGDKEETTVVEKLHKVKVEPSEEFLERVAEKKREKESNPPESIFNRLKPSEDRYTILDKDEL